MCPWIEQGGAVGHESGVNQRYLCGFPVPAGKRFSQPALRSPKRCGPPLPVEEHEHFVLSIPDAHPIPDMDPRYDDFVETPIEDLFDDGSDSKERNEPPPRPV